MDRSRRSGAHPIPLVALGGDADVAGVADAIDRALRDVGFVMVEEHGVESALIDEARRCALTFFHLPDGVKEQYRVRDNRGWIPIGHEATSSGDGRPAPPDAKESFTIGRDTPYPCPVNQWPTEVPGFRPALERLFGEFLLLGQRLLVLMARGLGVADDHFTRHAQQSPSELNLNWYPALSHLGAVTDGQFRIGPHTDFGGFTILDREPGAAGLQIQSLDGRWLDAPYVPGAFTINVADLLSGWTGGRWRSTPHRVLPPDPSAPIEELLSLAFFFEFDASYEVNALPPPVGGGSRFGPVTAGEYIKKRYRDITVGVSDAGA